MTAFVREQQAATAASASTWLPLRTNSGHTTAADLVAAFGEDQLSDA